MMVKECCTPNRINNSESKEETGECLNSARERCCGEASSTITGNNKSLKIEWQRLISNEETCPRCGSTEDELDRAEIKLKESLEPLGIEVSLEKKELSIAEFEKAPLQSNRIWIDGKPLEVYVDARVGKSPCCDVCGPSECRTVTVDGQEYETIPSEVIVRAGMVAATRLIGTGNKVCC
jgi:hypothetical protein